MAKIITNASKSIQFLKTSVPGHLRNLYSSSIKLNPGQAITVSDADFEVMHIDLNFLRVAYILDEVVDTEEEVLDITGGGGGGGSSVGVAGVVQTSDGSGGFAGDTGLTYSAGTLSVDEVTSGTCTLDLANGRALISGIDAVTWASRTLINSAGQNALRWNLPNGVSINQTTDITVGTSGTYGLIVDNNGAFDITLGSDATYAYLQSWENKPLQINNMGNNVIVLPQGFGRLGVGTTNPGSVLSVNGGVSLGAYAGTTTPTGYLILSGSLGVGVTSPTASVDVDGDVQASGGFLGNAVTAPSSLGLYATGYIAMNASMQFQGGFLIVDGTGITTIDPSARTMNDAMDVSSIDWDGRYLKNSAGAICVNWQNQSLLKNGVVSLDWGGGVLYDISAGKYSFNWDLRLLMDAGGTVISVDWANRELKRSSGIATVNWNNQFLSNENGETAFSWNPAMLAAPTISRPVGLIATGYFMFDTTLGKPIWWRGDIWVDAGGLAT